MYKCIQGFSLEKCDDDGFFIDGEFMVVEEGSIWNVPEGDSRIVGGEIRLENDSSWIEISENTFNGHFEKIR